jgi:hypothetical protein
MNLSPASIFLTAMHVNFMVSIVAEMSESDIPYATSKVNYRATINHRSNYRFWFPLRRKLLHVIKNYSAGGVNIGWPFC